MREFYLRQFVYDGWANAKEVDSLGALDTTPAAALKLLGHILGAQQIWLERLTGESARPAVWPSWDVAQCREVLSGLRERWASFIRDADLDRQITYTNSAGEAFESTVSDILSHVLYHGAYHRGQIATRMRDGGETPVYTDFIHATRSGAL